jgi:hypothetical protein
MRPLKKPKPEVGNDSESQSQADNITIPGEHLVDILGSHQDQSIEVIEADWEKAEYVLAVWCKRSRESSQAHYMACTVFEALHIVLAGAVIISTAIATLKKTDDHWHPILLVIVTILVSIQTRTKNGVHAIEHRKSAVKFAALRREVEALDGLSRQSRGSAAEAIRRATKAYNEITSTSPHLPQYAMLYVEWWTKKNPMSKVFGIDLNPQKITS